MNLIEQVKSKLPELASKVVNKKPQTKKRWWTKVEVRNAGISPDWRDQSLGSHDLFLGYEIAVHSQAIWSS